MKTKWQDFCESNYDYNVSCIFKDIFIKRTSINKNNVKVEEKSIHQIDFQKYEMQKEIILKKSDENKIESKIVKYKCRKIKI